MGVRSLSLKEDTERRPSSGEPLGKMVSWNGTVFERGVVPEGRAGTLRYGEVLGFWLRCLERLFQSHFLTIIHAPHPITLVPT